MLREEKDWTATEVAQLLRIPLREYSSYEKGSNEIPKELLDKMAKLFDVNSDYLSGASPVRRHINNAAISKT